MFISAVVDCLSAWRAMLTVKPMSFRPMLSGAIDVDNHG